VLGVAGGNSDCIEFDAKPSESKFDIGLPPAYAYVDMLPLESPIGSDSTYVAPDAIPP
jgi:hypothetical protein